MAMEVALTLELQICYYLGFCSCNACRVPIHFGIFEVVHYCCIIDAFSHDLRKEIHLL
jgi:hypothetical protein